MVRQPLAELLSASQLPDVQLAAIQSLGAQRGTDVGRLLLDRWPGVSPRCHNELLEVVFREEARLPELLDAVEKKIVPVAELGPDRRQRLFKHSTTAIRELAEKLLGSQATPNRKAVLERYQEVLKLPGDSLRGEKVFAKTCAGRTGPIAAGGRRRSAGAGGSVCGRPGGALPRWQAWAQEAKANLDEMMGVG